MVSIVKDFLLTELQKMTRQNILCCAIIHSIHIIYQASEEPKKKAPNRQGNQNHSNISLIFAPLHFISFTKTSSISKKSKLLRRVMVPTHVCDSAYRLLYVIHACAEVGRPLIPRSVAFCIAVSMQLCAPSHTIRCCSMLSMTLRLRVIS